MTSSSSQLRPLGRSFTLPKPAARGWVHAVTAPLALANAIVLISLAPGGNLKIACAVFGLCSVILFSHSALYHRGKWQERVRAVLQRMDHSNIFLLIAGTYTPLCVALLPPAEARAVLSLVWAGALAGICVAVLWITSPRWVTVGLYLALGWIALWYLPDFWVQGGPAIVVLLIAGGIIYTLGGILYATRWPNPWPKVWGFHEFFHVCTVAAYICQVVAVWLAVL